MLRLLGAGLGIAVLAAGTVTLALPAAAATKSCASTPFRSSAAKHDYYRIPAVVSTTRGTLLAFAEQRDSLAPSSDTGDVAIVEARSTDRGCSWSTPKVVADHGTDTVGNPTPVVDTTTGDVLLLSVDRPQGGTSLHGLHVQRSTDDGLTFSAYAASGDDLYGIPGWSGGLTGPGHAIQLQTGPHAGRIVVPIGYERDGKHGAYAIVSDDHGASWTLGFNSVGADTRMEGTVAQLPDGRLWISYHEQSPSTPVGTGRIDAFSSDGGSTLSTGFTRAKLPVVSVQGSSLALTGSDTGILLFSSPITKNVSVRRNLGIFVSRGASVGTSWSKPYAVQLEDVPASYSDLVQVDASTIGLLYETGTTSWHERIAFRTLPIAAVLAGSKATSSVKATVAKHITKGGTSDVHVTVKVPGTSAPAGTVRVRLTKAHFSRTITLPLVSTNSGKRTAQFHHVPRGTYTVAVTYIGTSNIRGSVAAKQTVTAR
jgi:sialidase-1